MKKTRQKIIETIGHIDRAMKHEGVIFGIAMVDNKEACEIGANTITNSLERGVR